MESQGMYEILLIILEIPTSMEACIRRGDAIGHRMDL